MATFSWFLYPISFIICANRLLALSLLCHEGLHGTLASSRKVNDFIGRYFCAIPTNISFSKYRQLHLFHHKAVGSAKWDPDFHLYQYFPIKKWLYFKKGIFRLLTGKTMVDFLKYYTDFFELKSAIFSIRKNQTRKPHFLSKSDWKSFYITQLCLFAGITYFSLWWEALFFYILPFLILVQPYVLLMGGLQHGPFDESRDQKLLSRTISGPKWAMEILLPLNINFHNEHHRNSKVPHYWLKKFSHDLKLKGFTTWEETYFEAIGRLFL